MEGHIPVMRRDFAQLNRPLIAVIIPGYNAEKWIARAIQSVLDQNYPNLEVIVIDDGSTDNSLDVIRSFGDRIRWETGPNRGAPAARNQGLALTEAEYVMFLDADDWLEHDFARAQLEAILKSKSDICFGCSALQWPDDRRIAKDSMPADSSTDFALSCVLSDGWYPLHAILWRTAYLRAVGGWDESLERNEDGELITRALFQSPVITASKGSRAIYYQHNTPGRISAGKNSSAIGSSIRVLERIYCAIEQRSDLPLARRALSRQAFELSSEAYFAGHRDLGRRAEAVWLNLGPPYQRTGSLAHRVGSMLVGLDRKCTLSRWLAHAKSVRKAYKAGLTPG